MSDTKNKENSKKYFIFKINEYFKNIDHTMQNKKCDSFTSMLSDVLEIQDEIYSDKNSKSKLQNSLDNLLEGIKFYCENNPVLVNHKHIKRDIADLLNKLKDGEKNYIALYHAMNSLLKKLSIPNYFINLHIDVVQTYSDIHHFAHIDTILDSFVSELIYHGHSIKYLQSWYKENIEPFIEEDKDLKKTLTQVIDLFRSISESEDEFEIIYNCFLPNDLAEEVEKDKVLIVTNHYKLKEYDEIRSLLISDNEEGQVIKSFPKEGTFNNFFLSVIVKSSDEYKAIIQGKTPLEEYLQMYRLPNISTNIKIHDFCLIKDNTHDNTWKKERSTSQKEKKKLSEREKDDINDLIIVRNNFRKKHGISNDLIVLEKSFYQIDNASNLSEENRLLNIWSSLEHILSCYTLDSIIGKTANIIPKVIGLYYIKGKMNILWDRLIPYQKREEISKLLTGCFNVEDSKKYDKEAFANLLKNKTLATELYNLLPSMSKQSIVLQRQIAEINGLFNNTESMKERIKLEHDIIKYDLYRIYRVRNKLVHSGNNIPSNLDITTERLLRYVNYLMGTIIFHMKRNPNLTIIDILNSIIQTYNWYIKTNIDDMNIQESVSVPYLYL